MNAGDIVELTENHAFYPNRGPRVILQAGSQYRVKKLIADTGFVAVLDSQDRALQLPVKLCQVVRKAKVQA